MRMNLKNPHFAALEYSPGKSGLRGMREDAAEGEARSRILPRGRTWGYAPSFPGSFAATTPAFFLSLSR
jgi:hypothetical protein